GHRDLSGNPRLPGPYPSQHLTCRPCSAWAPVSVERRLPRPPLGRSIGCPEVIRQPRVREIRIGHEEVACEAPPGAPTVAHDEAALTIIVPHDQHRMAPEDLLVAARQGYDAGLGHLGRLEALVDREAHDNGQACR